MLSKFLSQKFVFVSLSLSALLAVFFYPIIQIPFLSTLTIGSQKILILLFLAFLSTLFYFISSSTLKNVFIPKTRLAKILFFAIPLAALLSVIFAKESSNAFFGEGYALDSFVSFVALTFFAYAIGASTRFMPRMTWFMFTLASLLVTLPVMIGMTLLKLNFTNAANYFTKLVDSWDTVAAMSALVVVFILVYIETIAYNRLQKIIGLVIIALHLFLAACIVMPDTWYALTLSSLAILFINKNNLKKTFYKRPTFYVLILSLIMSISLTFSTTITSKIQTWTTNFSHINYNFVKPTLATSLSIDWQGLKSGKVFGEGSSRFYTLWREYKPKEVIESNFWDTDFISSYSAITTYGGTLGVFGFLSIMTIVISIFISIKRKLSAENFKDLDDENKFYLLASIAIFIFSTLLLFVFGNILISTILFVASTGLLIGRTIKWEEEKTDSRVRSIIAFILFVIVLIGFIIGVNRFRAVIIYNNAINQFNTDNNINSLESSMIRVAEISNDDSSYRQLSQFYVQKAQYVLSNSTSTDLAQKDFVAAANAAVKSAQTAISLNKNNYNNYMSLGTANELQSIIDKDSSYVHAKEAYTVAKNLYTNNPYIPLVLARLEWSHNQNATNTTSNIGESLQIKQNYSLAYYLLSQLAVQGNDKVSAQKYALLAIQADNTNVNAYTQYGILALNEKNLSEAELAFVSVLKLDQSNVNAIYYLAVTYILDAKYDIAQQLIDALKIKIPNSQEVAQLETYLDQTKSPKPAAVATSTKSTTSTTTASIKKK